MTSYGDIALSLSKGSSSWAGEDQPSNRRKHLLRPEKMTLSGIAKFEYGLGVETKGFWLIRNPLTKGKHVWIWGNTGDEDQQSRHLCRTARAACVPPSLPVCACPCSRGPLYSCLQGSLVPQGPLDLPAHQHFPLHKFWFSSLIVLHHLAWAFLHLSSASLVPEQKGWFNR